jgi:hypothetical protein
MGEKVFGAFHSAQVSALHPGTPLPARVAGGGLGGGGGSALFLRAGGVWPRAGAGPKPLLLSPPQEGHDAGLTEGGSSGAAAGGFPGAGARGRPKPRGRGRCPGRSARGSALFPCAVWPSTRGKHLNELHFVLFSASVTRWGVHGLWKGRVRVCPVGVGWGGRCW